MENYAVILEARQRRRDELFNSQKLLYFFRVEAEIQNHKRKFNYLYDSNSDNCTIYVRPFPYF